MKLLDKTLGFLLLISVLAIAASAGFQYYLTKSKIETNVDLRLKKEKLLIKQQLKDIQPEVGFSYNTSRSNVRFIEGTHKNCKDSIFNAQLLDADGEEISCRILSTCIELKVGTFRVEIKKEKTTTFIGSIFLAQFLILLAVVLLVILFKYFYLKNVWSPFFDTLQKIKSYDIQSQKVSLESNTNIKEFKELNQELQEICNSVFIQYQAQKSFTANASHELMTPITVVRNKLELLVQSENLGENELRLVADVLPKLDRIVKINKSLILLSKISHQHFDQLEKVDLVEQLGDVLNYFEDQIRLKNLTVRKIIKNELNSLMHPDLAHILMMNLVKNAVQHNIDGGWLTLSITDKRFKISNSGRELTNATTEMFARFTTDNSDSESIGLGLAIVHDIALSYNIDIVYNVSGPEHAISLTFPDPVQL